MAIGTVAPGTVADLLEQLGGIPPERVRLRPMPGTAKERDVIAAWESHSRLCELIDGVLVEKTVGIMESLLAMTLGHFLWEFLEQHDLGVVLGADGPLRILPKQVRIPDVCFISWDRLPGGKLPPEQIAPLAPDLAVEVLSPGNTKKEMERKLHDYFQAGVRLVWYIQPKNQTAEAYTSLTEMQRIGKSGNLDGSDVLPGFKLSLKRLFAHTERRSRRS